MITRCRAGALLALAAVSIGCSSDKTAEQVAAMNDSNIKRTVNLYTAYMAHHGWATPKSEEELKGYVKVGLPAENLKMMKVDLEKLDEVFVSERDGKPFKIKYGAPGGMGAKVPVVFEQDGQGGIRQVAYTFGKVEDADAKRYKELFEGKAPESKPGSPGSSSRPTGRPVGAPTGPTKN
ncbi:MAG: hypothetical protein U0746_17945 [Gemmataceae bacterium]